MQQRPERLEISHRRSADASQRTPLKVLLRLRRLWPNRQKVRQQPQARCRPLRRNRKRCQRLPRQRKLLHPRPRQKRLPRRLPNLRPRSQRRKSLSRRKLRQRRNLRPKSRARKNRRFPQRKSEAPELIRSALRRAYRANVSAFILFAKPASFQ